MLHDKQRRRFLPLLQAMARFKARGLNRCQFGIQELNLVLSS
jgi:hypothetical protein